MNVRSSFTNVHVAHTHVHMETLWQEIAKSSFGKVRGGGQCEPPSRAKQSMT